MLFACACIPRYVTVPLPLSVVVLGWVDAVDGMDNEIEVVDRLLGWIGVEDGAEWMRWEWCMQRDAMLST